MSSPGPKQRFQESKDNLAFWSELVAKATFIRGLDAALLQYNEDLPDSDDAMTSAARFQRIKGAKRYRDLLLGLHEIAREKTPLPSMNLDSSGVYNTGRALK